MNVAISPSASSESARKPGPAPPSNRAAGWTVAGATPADFTKIQQFLTAVFQGPSPTDFKSSLEDPFFEPYDRLLLKDGPRIVGHVHLTRRVMQLDSVQIPVAGLGWLGILPEARSHGCGGRLLVAAEQQMACHGALVGLLRTRIPRFFRDTGWALCGRHSYSQASPQRVLCGMLDQGLLCHGPRPRVNIRCWRRLELAALMRTYNQNLLGQVGPLERTEAYWRWFIHRRPYDQLFVALDGPDLLELKEERTPIVGYAMTRGDSILELLTAPRRHGIAVMLLARTCHEAIERGYHRVTLHAPHDHHLHEWFRSAGGLHLQGNAENSEVFMARLLKPIRLLRMLGPQWVSRAETAGLPRPLELGLLVDLCQYRVVIDHEQVTVDTQRATQHHVRLNVADFTRMVLGQLDWSRAYSEGLVEASTSVAREAASLLFPHVPCWRPPLDDLLTAVAPPAA